MKSAARLTLIFSIFALSFFCINTATAQAKEQTNSSALGCIDPLVRQEAQNIKDFYTKQGFTVFKDAMISIESMIQYPVIVQLHQGELYQICYVTNPAMSQMRMTLYDGNDTKIDEKINYKNRQQPNYIIYSYIPATTDDYLVTLMQKLKNKTVCGSFFILKANSDKTPENIEPYTEDSNKQ